MLKRSLNSLLFLTVFVAAQNQNFEGELEGVKRLALKGNDTIASFYPNKTTIGENELNQLEQSLGELDGKTKQKREANFIFKHDDEFADATNEDEPMNVKGNYDVKTSLTDVEVPVKGGSPAFSIHAQRVYILYPSLFQDPNIFGRFSIPQSINMDPIPEKQASKPSNNHVNELPIQMAPDANQLDNVNNNPYTPYQSSRRMSRRQAENPPPSNSDDNKKRNIETHLAGSIVVLNQDVNEINRKESY